MTKQSGLGDREPTRLCPNPRCGHTLTRRDERAGRCPLCRQILLSLAFEMAFVEEAEDLMALGDLDIMADELEETTDAS